MMADEETTLNSYLQDYRIITTVTESTDLSTNNLYNTIKISVEQKKKTPIAYFTRGLIPYLAPTENLNSFILGATLPGKGVTQEYIGFYAGVSYMNSLGLEMFYDLNEVRDAEHGTIGYLPNNVNMYGAFKPMFDQYQFMSQYPVFYSITAGNDPYAVSSFSGVTERGASAGCYTMVNFGGVVTPFQLMVNPATLGISNSNGLPTGTAGNPLYFALSEYTGLTSAAKSMYFTPNIHASLRRNINLYRDKGITFAGVLASFEPHYQFIKFADDAFVDTQTSMMERYVGNSANPAWSVELLRLTGSTSGINRAGFQLANDYTNRFLQELSQRPAVYNLSRNSYNIGHIGVPYITEVLGWSALIPTPGVATDATGPYAPEGDYYVTRLSELQPYPAPAGYTYGNGMSGWNSYRSARGLTTAYPNEYFMMGGSAAAASSTYASTNLIPANILTFFADTAAGLDPSGSTMTYLDSYYHDLYEETISYGGYRHANVFPMNFIPRFNPLFALNTTSQRKCTIHQDFGANANERLYNLKESARQSMHSSVRMWKLMLDKVSKYDYRILPVVRGRNEDYDLTRGGCVPYSPQDFVDYIIAPLFDGDVPANGFIMKDDIHDLLLNAFYYGNIGRGSTEFTKVITNRGISGADPATAFIRGLETYFFDLDQLQHQMSFGTNLDQLGITAAVGNFASYIDNLNSGRFSDYRVYETNSGTTGGNTKIPYGFSSTFRWYQVPLRTGCIMDTNANLKLRWTSAANNNIDTAYEILRDAYFELTKQQLEATYRYFEDSDITTFVQYRSTDKAIGR